MLVDSRELGFCLSALGDVFNGKSQENGAVAWSVQLAGVQEHGSLADEGKLVCHLKVVKVGFVRNDVFEQVEQLGNVPLPAAKLADDLSFCLFGPRPEGFVESAVGAFDTQFPVEDKKWVSDGIANVLGVGFDLLQQQFCSRHVCLFFRLLLNSCHTFGVRL